MTDKSSLTPRVSGEAIASTRRVLDAITNDPDSGVAETTNPEEIVFAQFLADGMALGHAYYLARGLGSAPSIEDQRRISPSAKHLRSKPAVKALIRRLLIEKRRSRMQEAELTRELIEQSLLDIITDDTVAPSARISAIDRLGKLTHVQAFAPPVSREQEDAGKSAAQVLEEIKAIVRKGAPK